MNFTEKLDSLMREKGINKSTLSKESGIPYTTIDGFYKKGTDNIKLSTLIKLCRYFHITLDDLVREEELPAMSKKDEQLFKAFSKLTAAEKENFLNLIQSIIDNR